MRNGVNGTAVVVGLAAAAWPAHGARAQTELDAAVEAARIAWLAHDVGALFQGSDTVRLHLPDIALALSVRPAQAARLLERYLKPADEHGLVLRGVRRLAADHAYAELARRYAVRGTSEQRAETVFVGFRRVAGVWRLREVRVSP